MGDNSAIEWTDATWNPIRGCAIVSKGCTNCYAMRQAHRSSGPGGAYEGLTKLTKGGPVWTGSVRLVPELLDEPLRWRRPRRIFVNSMSDFFHEDVPDEFIDRVWAVMLLSPRHTFQLLTKRPERMRAYLTAPGLYDRVLRAAGVIRVDRPELMGVGISDPARHPAPWIWLGVSVEDQQRADERIPLLVNTPAAVRWLSCEPLLGPVNIGRWLELGRWDAVGRSLPLRDLNWVVVGGESGYGARPMHPDWARSLRDQCAAAGVPFFFKQWGAWAPYEYRDAGTGHRLVKMVFNAREVAIGGPAEGTTPYNMKRLGKKLAGRELDGRVHEAYPA